MSGDTGKATEQTLWPTSRICRTTSSWTAQRNYTPDCERGGNCKPRLNSSWTRHINLFTICQNEMHIA